MPVRTNFRISWFVFAPCLTVQSLMVEKARWWELEAADYLPILKTYVLVITNVQACIWPVCVWGQCRNTCGGPRQLVESQFLSFHFGFQESKSSHRVYVTNGSCWTILSAFTCYILFSPDPNLREKYHLHLESIFPPQLTQPRNSLVVMSRDLSPGGF